MSVHDIFKRFRINSIQKNLKLLSSLSKDEVTTEVETIKTVLLFLLFKKRVSADLQINAYGRSKLRKGLDSKNFFTKTTKEFYQHLANSIYIAMYKTGISMETEKDFDEFLKTSKDEISANFRIPDSDMIESISYNLDYL